MGGVDCCDVADHHGHLVTRSHKYTDRDYSVPESEQQVHEPKYFAKNGFVDTPPSKVKKEGGGKGNW